MRINARELMGLMLSAAFLIFSVFYASGYTGYERDHWDDGYMHGYYHGNSDGHKGKSAPEWLEDLRMDN